MSSISSVYSSQVPIPPSCVAFSPTTPDLFVIGTYYLQKNENITKSEDEADEEPKPQSRNGSLILCKIDGDAITTIQTVATPSALLDLIFLPWSGHEHIFVTATSTGTLSFYILTSAPSPSIDYIYTHQCTDTSILLTDLEAHPDVPGLIGYVTSSGLVSIIGFDLDLLTARNEDVSRRDVVRYHHSSPCADEGFEAWTLAFALSSPSTTDEDTETVGVYTGSDDSTLRRLDFVPEPGTDSSLQGNTKRPSDDDDDDNGNNDDDDTNDEKPSATLKVLDRRSHTAGVVSILPLTLSTSSSPSDEFILTGSYDDHIRVLLRSSSASTPQVRNAVLAEENLGGGVWRLKLIHQSRDEKGCKWIVLASCMHAGTRVVRVTRMVSGEWTIEVLSRFEEHASMNYGSDVRPLLGSERETRTVVSTSFYDRLMCLWRVDLGTL
ncbi:hypothetical protein MBLNU457_7274t1 [Dothideomycetes sp. NU457]